MRVILMGRPSSGEVTGPIPSGGPGAAQGGGGATEQEEQSWTRYAAGVSLNTSGLSLVAFMTRCRCFLKHQRFAPGLKMQEKDKP